MECGSALGGKTGWLLRAGRCCLGVRGNEDGYCSSGHDRDRKIRKSSFFRGKDEMG